MTYLLLIFLLFGKTVNSQLTYSFINYTEDISIKKQIEITEDCLNSWCDIIGESIVKSEDSCADIKISFHPSITYLVGFRSILYLGLTNSLYVEKDSGHIMINDYFTFDTCHTDTTIDFHTLLLHETGHIFGLEHCPIPLSVMYPIYLGQKRDITFIDSSYLLSIYNKNK